MPAHRGYKSVVLTSRCIWSCSGNKWAADPFAHRERKGSGSPSASGSAELGMRALHRKGRMSGQIHNAPTAPGCATAAAGVGGAPEPGAALGEQALSLLVWDVSANECDYSAAHTSPPVTLWHCLTPRTCSLSALHRQPCCRNGNANVSLIVLSHPIWSHLSAVMHTHMHTLKNFCPEASKPNSALLVEETQQEVVQSACVLSDPFYSVLQAGWALWYKSTGGSGKKALPSGV